MKFPMNQLIAVVISNLGSFNCGQSIGWLSPALPQFRASPQLFGEITLEQSSWLAAILPLTVAITSIFVVYIAERWGRKMCITLTGIPFILGGITILLAKTINVVMISRFLFGVGIAFVVSNTTTYIGEIAEAKYRGILASFYIVLYTFGITSSYLFGGFISYIAGTWAIIIVGILNLIFSYFIPETPAYLIKIGKIKEASDAISWLYQAQINSIEVKYELERLQTSLDNVKLSTMESLTKIVTSSPLRYGYFMCLMMIFGQIYSGMFAVHSYSVSIFMDSGTDLTPQLSSVVYGCLQIIGALSTTWLVDRIGRKILIVTSFFGTAISMVVMGAYFDLSTKGMDLENFHWVPVVSLSFCVYIYTIGAGSIPYILLTDMLTNDVRAFGSMFIGIFQSLNTFILLKTFEPISAKYGKEKLFYFFSMSTLFSGIFTMIMLKETKGKTISDIVDGNCRFKTKLKITEVPQKY